jgi:hypothetical protein
MAGQTGGAGAARNGRGGLSGFPAREAALFGVPNPGTGGPLRNCSRDHFAKQILEAFPILRY